MRKKLYDFSISTAIIIILAYVFLFTISFFSIFNSEKTNWFAIIISVLLVISFMMIAWYYLYLAVTISEKGVSHGNKFIDKKDLKWVIKYNFRFRYYEIIFYSKYVNLDQLSKKEKNMKTIVVQYFPKYESLLNEYFNEK